MGIESWLWCGSARVNTRNDSRDPTSPKRKGPSVGTEKERNKRFRLGLGWTKEFLLTAFKKFYNPSVVFYLNASRTTESKFGRRVYLKRRKRTQKSCCLRYCKLKLEASRKKIHTESGAKESRKKKLKWEVRDLVAQYVINHRTRCLNVNTDFKSSFFSWIKLGWVSIACWYVPHPIHNPHSFATTCSILRINMWLPSKFFHHLASILLPNHLHFHFTSPHLSSF